MVKPAEYTEDLCFKCLEHKNSTSKFHISSRGYGSDFDNFNTVLQVCCDCRIDGIEQWFNEDPKMDDHGFEEYQYEENIHEFVDTLPIQGKELFRNQCANGATAYTMESQDWVDMKLGILPDEKYKEYGFYSPSEIDAYKEKYPTCENPVNIIWDEKSKSSWCPFGAHGEYNQEPGRNICDECYSCEFFKKREKPIKEMDHGTYKKYERYIRGRIAVENFKHLFEEE